MARPRRRVKESLEAPVAVRVSPRHARLDNDCPKCCLILLARPLHPSTDRDTRYDLRLQQK